MTYWIETHKGDARCRALADRHYSRQHVGAPMFCRPGYNQVLYAHDDYGEAAWVWFRPKWESGLPGVARKDGLQAIECTLFRNETHILSSELIREAVEWVRRWNRLTVLVPDGLITGVSSAATESRRGKSHAPGYCYVCAGWLPMHHRVGAADVWLWHPL